MNADRLVQMANSIGDFFAAMPDADEARDGIATHLRKFWDPRMRRDIFTLVDAHEASGDSGLSPLVLQALRQHREELAPLPGKA